MIMEEKITIYHNNACSKSREGLCLVENAGACVEVVEYLKNPRKRGCQRIVTETRCFST